MLIRTLALLFFSIGGFIIVCNWLTPLQTRRTGRNHSAIPLLGAAFAGAGLWLLPAVRRWTWAPFLVDFGTLLVLVSLPYLIYNEWQTSRLNLVAEYSGRRDTLIVHIRLYRRGHCTVVDELQRAPGEQGMTHRSVVGTWRREDDLLTVSAGGEEAVFAVGAEPGIETLRLASGFAARDVAPELSLSGVELRRRAER